MDNLSRQCTRPVHFECQLAQERYAKLSHEKKVSSKVCREHHPQYQHWREVHKETVEGTGLNFAPKCDNFCFTRKSDCDHIKNNVPFNNLGDCIVFPSNCIHQGYYNSDSDIGYVIAQLFAFPAISIACEQLTLSHTKELDFIQNNLNNDTVTALSNDILQTGILPTPLNVLVRARTLMGQLIGIPIVRFLTLSFMKLHC